MGDLIEPPPPTDLTQAPVRLDDDEEDNSDLRSGSSAKIDQLVHLLKLTPSTEKSLVFSQFTSFLDKVHCLIHFDGIRFYSYLISTDYRNFGTRRVNGLSTTRASFDIDSRIT